MMKPFLLTLALAVICSTATFGQTEKGSKMLGGTGNLGFSDGISVTVQPSIGFFVADNFAIGSALGLYYYNRDDIRQNGIAIQPFIRYYIGESMPIRPFVEASGGYMTSKTKYSYSGNSFEQKYNNGFFGAGVGAAYFLTNQVGLEAMLYYRTSEDRGLINYQGNSRLGISFGFQIYLPGSSAK
ncbi:porin family protein [Pontibacter qinzhouensis]|uniref:Porin family protein n=1 Tax=Pontibacter qinzhouensis TaxID=2603253 RepID=A0A5C8IN96_9BACT|nr:outer membrane beta-barrel protein [Pontibacter qinzhouensis]TXK22476.1 porin family protein [Pontibacter qinzhouensis]